MQVSKYWDRLVLVECYGKLQSCVQYVLLPPLNNNNSITDNANSNNAKPWK